MKLLLLMLTRYMLYAWYWLWFEYEIITCMSMNYVIKEEEPIRTVLPEWLEYEYTCVMITLMNDKNA